MQVRLDAIYGTYVNNPPDIANTKIARYNRRSDALTEIDVLSATIGPPLLVTEINDLRNAIHSLPGWALDDVPAIGTPAEWIAIKTELARLDNPDMEAAWGDTALPGLTIVDRVLFAAYLRRAYILPEERALTARVDIALKEITKLENATSGGGAYPRSNPIINVLRLAIEALPRWAPYTFQFTDRGSVRGLTAIWGAAETA
jgi:hypothetical protein